MSDHADKLRDILELTDCSRGQWEPLLDALVAERDSLIGDREHWRNRAKYAEAERDLARTKLMDISLALAREFVDRRHDGTDRSRLLLSLIDAALAAPTKEGT